MKGPLFVALSALVTGAIATPSYIRSPPAGTQNTTFTERCSALAKQLKIPGANRTAAEYVAAGTQLQFPNATATCTRPSQNVSVGLCRVSLQVATSARSGIKAEVWLPEKWTGRFLSTGNGGIGGCIQYEDLEYAASLGFATVGTNNGHDGMGGESFLNNPDVIEDYVYRAVVTGARLGKKISNTFYSAPHSKSYYLGCSTGGRQVCAVVSRGV